jgi:hypothetical protein
MGGPFRYASIASKTARVLQLGISFAVISTGHFAVSFQLRKALDKKMDFMVE